VIVVQPEAARSLRAGLEGMFAIDHLDMPLSLRQCLATTNIIENPQSGVRRRTSNLCRWREGGMMLRCVAELI
jgi:hypothetical protein